MRTCISTLFALFLGLAPAFASAFGADAPSASPTTRPAPFEREIEAFEKRDRENPPPKDANLFIGSSSIVKWKTLAEDFPGVPVINRGFGGSRIVDSVRFADRIVLPYHPKRIFLYAGDNDIAGKRSPQEVLGDFKAFVEKVRAGQADVPIYFISIKPSPARIKLLAKGQEANALIRAYTEEGRNLHYIDIATAMLDSEGKPRGELFGLDRLHMNREGYKIWAGIIGPLLKDAP